MPTLSTDSVDFARRHIEAFWDSDFFPKAFEFDCLWHQWDEVRSYLVETEISQLEVVAPRTLPAPKPSGGYRIVHQLDPVNALAYTAMAYMVAPCVEEQRPAISSRIACSYRFAINPSSGSFFGSATGYPDFVQQSRDLASQFPFVLATDITDFYNQIYLHRLQNNLASAGVPQSLASAIERFLIRINDNVSHGVPVGPVASIIMSEAALLDIDQFITNKGFPHTRYVDDMHIFGKSRHDLRSLLQLLTQYLHSNHRLVLSSGKTHIIPSQDFLNTALDDPEGVERREMHEALNTITWANRYELADLDEDSARVEAKHRPTLMRVLMERVCAIEPLNLGLARHILRRARKHRIRSIIPPLLDHFAKFSPVINDVVLYLSAVINRQFISRDGGRLFEIVASSDMLAERFVRTWISHLICRCEALFEDPRFRRYLAVYGDLDYQAHGSLIGKDVAWVRDRRNSLENVGSWQRRQLLRASLALGPDERQHWCWHLLANNPQRMDRWLLVWLLSM